MSGRVQFGSPIFPGVAARAPSRHPTTGAIEWIRLAVRRWRERRILAELDDRMLRDIGINWFEAMQEAGKPFWMR